MTYEQYLQKEWDIWNGYCNASGLSPYPCPPEKVTRQQWEQAQSKGTAHLLEGECY